MKFHLLNLQIRVIAAILVNASLAMSALASEVDSFTHRTPDLKDALPELNLRVNQALKDAAAQVNSRTRITRRASPPCDPNRLIDAMKARTVFPLVGQIESEALFAPGFPRAETRISESVFRHFKFFEVPQMWVVPLTLSALLRAGDHYIGADKIGHFFSEGWEYYKMIRRDGRTLQDALKWGIMTEDSYFGLTMNGIKSYGDLVANYQGFLFWDELVSHYFSCKRGVWKKTREFDFARYIDAGWDEAINCAEYRTKEMAAGVNAEIRALERKRGVNLQCPISTDACVKLLHKYGRQGGYFLSPACTRVADNAPNE